jgi:hypothetical protein
MKEKFVKLVIICAVASVGVILADLVLVLSRV